MMDKDDVTTIAGGLVQAVPKPSDGLGLYRMLPFSYEETSCSQQRVHIAAGVTVVGQRVEVGAAASDSVVIPTYPFELPTFEY